MDEAWKANIAQEVRTVLPARSPLRVLEAGGGKRTHVDFLPSERFVTTIDIDPTSLSLNNGADEKIVGDIQIYEFGDRRFDLIICWDVLEHVASPKSVIGRLCEALAPGGVLLIKGPVDTSFKAMITRATPHWLHVLIYRYLMGSKTAGQPGYGPFPVEFDVDAGDNVLLELLRLHRLQILKAQRFEGVEPLKLRHRAAPVYALYAMTGRFVTAVTRGRWGTLESDFFILAQRAARA